MAALTGCAAGSRTEGESQTPLARYVDATCRALDEPAEVSPAVAALQRIQRAGGLEHSPYDRARTLEIVRGVDDAFAAQAHAAARIGPPARLARAHRSLTDGYAEQSGNYRELARVLAAGGDYGPLYRRFVRARNGIGAWLNAVERVAVEEGEPLPPCFRGFRAGFDRNR